MIAKTSDPLHPHRGGTGNPSWRDHQWLLVALFVGHLLGFSNTLNAVQSPDLPSPSELSHIPDCAPSLDFSITALAAEPPLPITEPRARIAIIIDDIGYDLKTGQAIAELPAAITLAVLPFGPHSLALAELGHRQGKQIMLHAPMSTQTLRPLDKGELNECLTESEFRGTLTRILDAVPHVRGVNNHMGSLLTQQAQPMGWLMQELQRRQLFFIDSRTTADTVALRTAQREGIASRKRDVFLDNVPQRQAIERQFAQLIRQAREQGSAIAIGHPYPETYAFLRSITPTLDEMGIQLVPVSELLPPKPPLIQPPLKPTKSVL